MIVLRTVGVVEIELNGKHLGPSAGKTFAGLMYLAVERDHRASRACLKELFFPSFSERQAGHSLRQLLYQINRLGASLLLDADTVSLPPNSVEEDYSALLEADELSDSTINALGRGFLPGFAPSISTEFESWLDVFRQRVTIRLLNKVHNALAACRQRAEWERVAALARACLALDPLNHQGTVALAESLAMVGSSQSALEVLDRYSREIGDDWPQLAKPSIRLRQRIAEGVSRHQDTQGRLVGRQKELSVLHELLQRSAQGESCLLFIHGEPGIGKSRVTEELATWAELNGTSVLRLTARPHDWRRPLSIFAELAKRLQSLPGGLGCSPESAATLAQLYARTGETQHSDTESRVERRAGEIANSISDLFDAVCAEQRLLVTVDDAHHLDRISARLLVELASERSGRRMMIVCTSRAAQVESLGNHLSDRVTRFRLGPLADEDARLLLDSIWGDEHRVERPSVAEWCLSKANGNPFFLTTLARHLAVTAFRTEVPEGLNDLLRRHLLQLTPSAQLTLQTVCLLGRHAHGDRVRRVLRHSRILALSDLQLLHDLGLVRHDGSVWQCAHDLLADVVLSGMSPGVRQTLHRYCAQLLERESRTGPDMMIIWDCAEHWRQAGSAAKAVSLLKACAAHCSGLGHPHYAAELLIQAASLTSRAIERRSLLSESLQAAYQASDARLILRSLAELRALGAPARRILERDNDLMEVRARAQLGEDISGFGDRLCQSLTSPSSSAVHKCEVAEMIVFLAFHDWRSELAAKAAIVGDMSVNTPAERERVDWFMLLYETHFGSLKSVADLCTRLSSRIGESPRAISTELGLSRLAYSLHFAGELETAASYLHETFDRASTCGILATAHWAASLIAERLLNAGDIENAKRWSCNAQELQRRLPFTYFTSGCESTVIRIAIAEGRPDEAEALLCRAESEFGAMKHARNRALAASYRAAIAFSRGITVSVEVLQALENAFRKAARTQEFDEIALGYWQAMTTHGRMEEASAMLRSYLRVRRGHHPLIAELRLVRSQLAPASRPAVDPCAVGLGQAGTAT